VPVRLLFYVAEAALLTIPTAVGLLLVHRAARRLRYRVFEVTRLRLAAIFAGLAVFGAATGELVGPQCIVQYYVAVLAAALGALSWVGSLIVVRRWKPPAKP
jgi:hypothetical protein